MKHSALKITLGVLIILTMLAAASCGASEPAQSPTDAAASTEAVETTKTAAPTEAIAETVAPTEQQMLSLTLDELAEFDGQDGRPAYVAVDGKIYDVSAIAAWMGGTHNDLFAGNDLTEPINNISPHGLSVLSKLPLVGTLVE